MRALLWVPLLLGLPGPCQKLVRTETYPDGAVRRVSQWQAGHLHGDYREVFPDGGIAVEGAYRHGLASQTWIHRWPNGTVRLRQTFVDGLRDGPAGEWHEDGSPRVEGEWRAGDKQGVWSFYGPEGALVARETWDAGTRVAIERL